MVYVVVVEPVEEGQLLGTVRLVVGGVDVENDLLGVRRQRFDVALLQVLQQAAKLLARRRILIAAQGRLRGQSSAIARATVAGGLQQRIKAQPIRVVAVLVPQSNLKNPL